MTSQVVTDGIVRVFTSKHPGEAVVKVFEVRRGSKILAEAVLAVNDLDAAIEAVEKARNNVLGKADYASDQSVFEMQRILSLLKAKKEGGFTTYCNVSISVQG